MSIVIPVYNESERIGNTLEQLAAYLTDAEFHSEVIIVDDGSSDDTATLVASHANRFENLQLLQLNHGGKARAVLAGLGNATGDIVGFMDADLATPLWNLTFVLTHIGASADLVIGSREEPDSIRIGEPGYRHLMGRVFNFIVRLLLLPELHDSQCGFKFMTDTARDQILPSIQLYANDEELTMPRVTAFDVELLFIARQRGLKIDVIPVEWSYGTHSKVNPLRDTFHNVWDVLRVWINGKRGRYATPEARNYLREN